MNNELHIGGDSYGPNAVGRDARAWQHNVTIGSSDPGRLGEALDALRTLVERHREQIPEAARVQRDLDALEQEIHEADPDPHRLRDTLKRIGGRVVTVAPVVGAVNDLRDIVESMLA